MTGDTSSRRPSDWVSSWTNMSRRAPPARRPWQFKLRMLLFCMFGAACFFAGWAANEARHLRDVRLVPVVVERFPSGTVVRSVEPVDDLFGDDTPIGAK